MSVIRGIKINLNKYEQVPRRKLTDNKSNKYIENGTKNSQFYKYDELYYGSPTHKSVIDRYVSYILGEKLVDKNGYDISKILSKNDLMLFVKDYKKSGQAALHVIYSASGLIKKLKHIPIRKLMINAEDDILSPITGYWYSFDWQDNQKWGDQFIPSFGYGPKGVNGNPLSNEIFYLRQPDDTESYSLPDWEPGIQFCEDELELSNFLKNHIKKKLSVNTIINLNVGEGMTDEKVDEYVEQFLSQFTGSGGDTYALTVNKNADLAPTITSVVLDFNTAEFQFLLDTAKTNILQSHGVNNPSLFNVITPSGFTSQAEDKEVSEMVLKDTIIKDYRYNILEGLNDLFKVNSDTIDLVFLDKGQDLDNLDNKVDILDIESRKSLISSQTSLRASVAGIGGIIQIQQSVSAGITTYQSALSMLENIYGYSKEVSISLLGQPKEGSTGSIDNPMFDIKNNSK